MMNAGREAVVPNTTTTATLSLSPPSSSSMKMDEGPVWEKRPCGMLVQKRSDNADHPAPSIRVRVAYGAARFEISISSQTTFGELKKVLTPQCGLQHWEQRLIYRGKQRENKEFLDICRVKDGSKIVLVEDPCSREKRFLEMCKTNNIQRAHRAISDISSQLDCFTKEVYAIENSIENENKVAEVQITTLIELLMRQAVKLDIINIPTDEEISNRKKSQGRRVQKCVEILDKLKISNAKIKPVVVSTKWETFNPPPKTTQYRNLSN